MSIILCITDPGKTLTDEQWENFGHYSSKGVKFTEFYSPFTDYILELPAGVMFPKAFYEGFFKEAIEKNDDFNYKRISTRAWFSKFNTYLNHNEILQLWAVERKYKLNAKPS